MRDLSSSLTGLPPSPLTAVICRPRTPPRRGRPWALPLERRVVIGCTSLRTNLTVRELAAVFVISPAQAHRIVTDIVQRLAALLSTARTDRRRSWILDGTLVPVRDHAVAAKSKNDRWSCNAQVLVRRVDLYVIAVGGGGPGNRNDPVHYGGPTSNTCVETMVASSLTAGIARSPSSSHPCFVAGESSATGRGGAIAGDAHASNMPSPDSRTGACCATIADAAGAS